MPEPDKEAIEAITLSHINAGKYNFFKSLGLDIVIGNREGCYLWDLDGERYLDVLCDGTTYNFGHRNPEIIRATKEALDRVDIGCQFLPAKERALLTREIIKLCPGTMNYVHYVPSGSEANDAAIKSARLATGRQKIVCISKSFHGVTGLAGKASDMAFWQPFGNNRGEDEYVSVPWNDIKAMGDALSSGDVAAVLMETIPATVGWPMPDDDYHSNVRDLCTQHGTLLILDEIQTGLGRSGSLWGLDKWGIKPDMMVVAKGIGGGIYPFAFVAMTDEAAVWTKTAPLGMPSTFGGSEIGCVIARKVLNMASNQRFLSHVREMANLLTVGLAKLSNKMGDRIVETRQLGLGCAIKFDDPLGGLKMMKALYGNNVLAIFAGYDPSVIQLKPPLVIEANQVAFLLDAIEQSMGAMDENIEIGELAALGS